MEDSLLVLTNMPDAQSAQDLARHLVELRLAACVNILPGVQSVYRWDGAIEEASEVTLLIKTMRGRYAEIEAVIKQRHVYQIPEIIAVSIENGLPAYLDWMAQETKKDINA